MQITWFGLNCFKIQSKDIILITDPYFSKETGLKPPSLKADIVVSGNPDGCFPSVKPLLHSEKGGEEIFCICSPGEYERKGIFVYGIPAMSSCGAMTIYRIDAEGLNVAYLGGIDRPLDEKQLEKLNGIDILLIPVGGDGKSVVDGRKAAEITSQIEPRLVIPMWYKIPNLKMKLEGADKFFREMGLKPEEPADKLKILKKDLPQEETKIILLKA